MVFRNFKMRVSATQIYKFDFKFERKKPRRRISPLDEAEMSRARAHTSSMQPSFGEIYNEV